MVFSQMSLRPVLANTAFLKAQIMIHSFCLRFLLHFVFISCRHVSLFYIIFSPACEFFAPSPIFPTANFQ